MARTRRSQEIRSLSEFRASASRVVRGLRRRTGSIVLTQRGRETAVVMGKGAYDALIEELELLRDIREAEVELNAGRGMTTTAAMREVRARLAR